MRAFVVIAAFGLAMMLAPSVRAESYYKTAGELLESCETTGKNYLIGLGRCHGYIGGVLDTIQIQQNLLDVKECEEFDIISTFQAADLVVDFLRKNSERIGEPAVAGVLGALMDGYPNCRFVLTRR